MTLKTDNMMDNPSMEMPPIFYELQHRLFELERRVDEYHSGNWN
jgi:hypothetical protein